MNEALTGTRITDAIKDYQRAEPAAPPEPPPIIEHPVDPELQPGESARLGGGMSIGRKNLE